MKKKKTKPKPRGFFDWEQLDRIEAMLTRVDANITRLLAMEKKAMAGLADIKAAVDAEKTVEDKAVALIQTLSDQLKAALANNDPVAAQAIVDQINAQAAVLAASVASGS